MQVTSDNDQVLAAKRANQVRAGHGRTLAGCKTGSAVRAWRPKCVRLGCGSVADRLISVAVATPELLPSLHLLPACLLWLALRSLESNGGFKALPSDFAAQVLECDLTADDEPAWRAVKKEVHQVL